MKHKELFIFQIIIAILLLSLLVALLATMSKALADSDKVYWCHCVPNGNCNTLHISQNALEQAGHVNAQGNILHAGDYAGRCETTPTPTNTPRPTVTPTPIPTITPTITPTPTQKPEETPEPTPTANPTQEQRIGDPPSGEGKHNETVCNGVPIDAPILGGFEKTSKTSVFWKWWGSLTQGITRQWIEYGYEKGNYPYAVEVSTSITGFEIEQLDPNAKQNWARVCVEKDGCNVCSNDLDP